MFSKLDPRLWYKQISIITGVIKMIGGENLVYQFAAMYDKIGLNRYGQAIRMSLEYLEEGD